jgi:Holliday junction resolvase
MGTMIEIKQGLLKEQQKKNKTLVYQLGLRSRTQVFFWSDGSITIEGRCKKNAFRIPRKIKSFVSFQLHKPILALLSIDNQTIAIEISIKERRVKGKLLAYLIREVEKKEFFIKENKGKEIRLFITAEHFQHTELFETIQNFVHEGGDCTSIQKLLEESLISNKLSPKEKINWLKNYQYYLTRELSPEVSISFADEKIKLFNDPIVAAQIEISGKKTVYFSYFIDELLLQNDSHLYYLRDNTLFTNSVIQGEYGKSLTTSFTAPLIILFWGEAVQKTKSFFQIMQLKKEHNITDPRVYFGLNVINNRNDAISLYELIENLASNHQILPLIREHVMTSTHADEKFEHLVQSLLSECTLLPNYFLFEEGLLASKDGAYQKIVDFFLITNIETPQWYSIELKTLENFHYKTLKLKRTIAEYSYLHDHIPEAGIPVIIVNWSVSRRWRDYASNFGQLLLDVNDINQMENLSDFVQTLQNYTARFLFPKIPRQQLYYQRATKLVNDWLETRRIPWDEIGSYSNYMGFTIDSIKQLLTKYQVMSNIDVVNRYHDHKPVIVDNPQALKELHTQLLQEGTALVLKEELDYCRQQIKKVKANPQIDEQYTSRSVTRRRQTHDLPKLQALEQNLVLLLSMQPYWGLLEPLVVRLYHHSENEGREFEEAISKILQSIGYQVIRHTALRIGRRNQEVDLIAYLFQPSNQLLHRCIISCTDKSSINSQSLRKFVQIKYQVLATVIKALDYTYDGILFVLVSQSHSSIINDLSDFFETHSHSSIRVIFIYADEIEHKTAILEKYNREVSFESIYILKRKESVLIIKIAIRIRKMRLIRKRKKRFPQEREGKEGFRNYTYFREPLLMTA